MEIMEMTPLNKLAKQNKQREQIKRKRHGRFLFVPLLLVISLITAGCTQKTGNKGTEAPSVEMTESSESAEETSVSESTSEEFVSKIDTPGGEVEVVGFESGEPSLEPEDLIPEGYEGEIVEESSEEETTSETTVEEPSEESTEATAESTSEAESSEEVPASEETQVVAETPQPVVNPAPASDDPMTRVIDFATLQATKNSDIYAWISVPGTNVDYPVLQHPSDNGYYLYHNLNHSQGYPGCIYTENYNSKNWSDPVTVLYGHDMRSTGTMFHQLHKFEKQSFFDQHEYFYIYTPEKTQKYRIFSAFVNSNEHLLGSHNFYDKDEFDAFFGTVLGTSNSVSHVREGVSIDSNSKIVALSTCIKNQPNNRYIIFGVLVE